MITMGIWTATASMEGLSLKNGAIECLYKRGEYRVLVNGKITETGMGEGLRLGTLLDYLSSTYGRA